MLEIKKNIEKIDVGCCNDCMVPYGLKYGVPDGLVVDCLTRDQGVAVLSLTEGTAFCP